ncbi:hypothetical protein RclHR1_01440025 [Rhizophagus clarus]|uniref:Uncharacterized protein n=1 Tax=Rhizophagus clarus TaxID=94130 RepID=A0A2Z6QCH9_9GLOM|nr:hypothetical protein RclHR1_01440025 [Rhizophagus clarus]GES78301.1 hypothetical protein RCL_e2082_RclHR1_01440025 [Rhizophagus clarus]
MKKGFLLSKPAPKTASTSSTIQVTPTTALKSIPSDRFHDVIVKFITGLIDKNSPFLFSSIIALDLAAVETFLHIHKDQVVPLDKLAEIFDKADCYPLMVQFLASFLNVFLSDDDLQEIFLMDSEIR